MKFSVNASSLILGPLLAAVAVLARHGDATADTASKRIEDLTWAVRINEQYGPIHPNITYLTANNFEAKLNLYSPRGNTKPRPTLLYMFGGGWLGGWTKETDPFTFLPFLQIGWNVVSIDYRTSSVSLAPAAVEDCLCALRWVVRNAAEYHFDTHQIVVMGRGAGGLLALTTGMIPMAQTGLGAPCDVGDMDRSDLHGLAFPTKVAAIVDWNGLTDVADIIEGPNQKGYAVKWVGNQSDRMAVAKLVSPLSYVRPGLPPIITVHGDKDPIEPYSEAVRLHDALTKAGVTNKLITIPDGGHAEFGVAATRDAWLQIFDFLEKSGLDLKPE